MIYKSQILLSYAICIDNVIYKNIILLSYAIYMFNLFIIV